jgi:thioredoxin reductase
MQPSRAAAEVWVHYPIDPTSVAGKEFPVTEHIPLLVLGAGPAGVAAAIESARCGLHVALIDEHPVASALIGLDVPYMFGERLDPSVQNKARMAERVVGARPELGEAFEAEVDVRLGVYAWGGFVTGATSRALPHPVLGLADEERSWLVTFDRIIVAAGARDLALAFPGWDRPGVMGARGADAAIRLYQAFTGRRIAILGSGALAVDMARSARAAGAAVAGIVDVAAQAALDAASLRALGIPLHMGHAVRATLGATEVEGMRIAPLGDPDAVFDIACDTVVCAVDLVPNVELLDLFGCTIVWRPELGGFVPQLDADGRTSVPGIYAAGDCTGVTDAAIAGTDLAAAAGRRAARAAARDAGIEVEALPKPSAATGPATDRDALRRQWLAAHADAARADLMICRCEEVGLHALLGVRPPRYLSYNAEKFTARDLRTLAAEGPINQDQIKRLTRAGMGACQGRRCREQVQVLLAMQGNQPTGSIAMPSYRAPLRPLPLNVLSAHDETKEMRDNWVVWFGIPGQWLPQWEPVPEGAASLYESRVLRDFET